MRNFICGTFLLSYAFLILFNMLLSLCDDCPYMTICKRVEHRFSFSSALYQLILLQNAKLVGNCGLCHVQCFCQVADAYLCLKQDKQDLDPRGITKYLEKLCQIVKLCFIRHGLIDNLYQIFMNLTGVTAQISFIRIDFCHFVSSSFYRFFTNRARIAFRTARIITPTSAKIAIHMLAIPMAPRSRNNTLIPIAK